VRPARVVCQRPPHRPHRHLGVPVGLLHQHRRLDVLEPEPAIAHGAIGVWPNSTIFISQSMQTVL
jgi:hypothetical protein